MAGNKNSGPKKGETNNPKGRPKGIGNKSTQEAKLLFNEVITGEIDNIKAALDLVRIEKPDSYLHILAKYLNYIYPKGIDITTDGEKIGSIIDLSNLSDEQLEILAGKTK